jgi:hypothetical protein
MIKHLIAVRLAAFTPAGDLLVTEDGKLPFRYFMRRTPARWTATEILMNATGIDLSQSQWLVISQVGFFETPLYDEATVLYSVALPQRVSLKEPNLKWITFDGLSVMETTYSLLQYACNFIKA